jgi:cell division septation protein DedD
MLASQGVFNTMSSSATSTAEEYDDSYDDEFEEDGEITISGFTVLLVALVVIALFSAIVFFAYQQGIRKSASTGGAVPTIAADPSPVRTERDLASAPAERGEVYDRLEGNTPTEVIVEAEAGRDPLEGFDETISASTPGAVETQTSPDAIVTQPVESQPASSDPIETASVSEPANTQPAANNIPVPTPAPANTNPATTPAAAGVTTGTHVVQVGAFRSRDEAMTFYNRLISKHGTFVSGKSPDVQRADLGAKGIYYRLRIGPFASKDAAATYCTSLKERGQDCLIKAR